MLGVIELAQQRRRAGAVAALCEAAINQVAEDAKKRDFRDAVPRPRHRQWAVMLAVPSPIAVALFVFVPAAASNAAARFLMPWRDTPRYTFAAVRPLPERLVVAHGEPFAVAATLDDGTVWHPERGTARLGDQPAVAAKLNDGHYDFALPAADRRRPASTSGSATRRSRCASSPSSDPS